MAIAAVPNYLGIDFEQASPGMRFGMYLPLWGVDSENSMPLWTTHDVNYRATGQRNEMRRFEDKNKTVALSRALPLSRNDLLTMAALAKRQSAIAAPLADLGCLLIMHGLAVAPFTTGLGNEHPLENGFAFLNPYGLPYLAGSGIKGVMRQAARELASHDWGDNKGWNHAAITALFGKTSANGENDLQSGALMFWDVIPQIEGDKLQVEVMTPHQSHYYQNGQSPHESGQPNPINFLVVPPGSKFEFHVQCDLSFLGRLMPDLAIDGRWQNLLVAALSHAFEWLGFGAKTAVGYGAMREDEKAGEERERQTQLRRETAEQLAREKYLSQLSPEQREAEEAAIWIAEFREVLNAERKHNKYKAGSAFDQQRSAILNRALTLLTDPMRKLAAQALRESYKFTDWPAKKERKQEVKQRLTELDGLA